MRTKYIVFVPDDEHWLQFELEQQRWLNANLPKQSYSLSPEGVWWAVVESRRKPLLEEYVPKPLRLLALML